MSGDSGLVIVYTGRGKGKTTAALGMALRAVGHGFKVVMIQFIKGSWFYGELNSSAKLQPDFELVVAGKGFVGIVDDNKPVEDHVKAAQEALQVSREKLASGKYDIIILDEINYAVDLKLITVDDVLELIKIKPKKMTLVLTGNYAKEKVIEAADLVTEMKEIKHPYSKGKKAKKGVDF
ncbi:MAG: cob(I)yrinic acid a,c-diamide adenosyltransferase [Nitrososphaerales archaeon]